MRFRIFILVLVSCPLSAHGRATPTLSTLSLLVVSDSYNYLMDNLYNLSVLVHSHYRQDITLHVYCYRNNRLDKVHTTPDQQRAGNSLKFMKHRVEIMGEVKDEVKRENRFWC